MSKIKSNSFKISVLTATLNSEATIKECLDSFFEQSWLEKEIIILDGGSTDRTLEIVNQYSGNDTVITSEKDFGMYEALNRGLRLVKGDGLGFLHSDDTYHDRFSMEKIASGLLEYDMVHGNVNYVSDHNSKRLVRSWEAEDKPVRGFLSGWMPCHTSFYVRTHVMKSVGDFNLRYRISADYDWMIRAIEKNEWTLGTINEVLIDMKIGGVSTRDPMTIVKHNLESLKIRQDLLGSGFLDYALIAKPLRKLRQFITVKSSR